MWQKAKAGLEVAEKSFERVERLYKEGVLPAQKYDEATAQLNAMRATERAARSQYDMAMNGAQREDKWAAQALVERACRCYHRGRRLPQGGCAHRSRRRYHLRESTLIRASSLVRVLLS